MTLLKPAANAPATMVGDLPVTSRYTFGLAGERFFRALKDEGRILGSHCQVCDHTYVPATQFCERCMAELDPSIDMGTEGEVQTFTWLFVNPDGSRREKPELIAFVQFGDGGLIHRLGEVDPDEVAVGMVVEAVLKPPGERTGSILDILYFKPI
jgi:uncharacterized OB-fold protein